MIITMCGLGHLLPPLSHSLSISAGICASTHVCVLRDVCVLLVNAPLNVICMKHSHNVSVWPLPYQKYLVDEWTLQQCVCLCERVCVSASMAALQT